VNDSNITPGPEPSPGGTLGSGWMIAFLVLGSVILVVLLSIGVLVYLVRRRRARKGAGLGEEGGPLVAKADASPTAPPSDKYQELDEFAPSAVDAASATRNVELQDSGDDFADEEEDGGDVPDMMEGLTLEVSTPSPAPLGKTAERTRRLKEKTANAADLMATPPTGGKHGTERV
jgi:hypothetical protein